MCSKTTCRVCGKFTYTGCGEHVEQALFGIPQDQICQGHDSTDSATNLFSSIFRNN